MKFQTGGGGFLKRFFSSFVTDLWMAGLHSQWGLIHGNQTRWAGIEVKQEVNVSEGVRRRSHGD